MLRLTPRTRAIAEVVSGALALLAFVATSPPPEPQPDDEPDMTEPSGGWSEPQSAAVVLHNALDSDVVVRIRRLSAAVDLECSAIVTDAGALLSEPLLGPTESWTIPAGNNLGLDAEAGRRCEVLRIEGDGFAPRWVIWDDASTGTQTFSPNEQPSGPGVIRLASLGSGAHLEGREDLVFAPEDLARGVEQCAPVGDGDRLAWGDPLPQGGRLLSAAWGPDGCGSIVFAHDGETPGAPWYLCVPEAAWRFEIGEDVAVTPSFSSVGESVTLTSADETGALRSQLQAFRASDPPSIDGLTMVYEPNALCGYDVDTRCGTVSRTGRVVLSTSDGAQAPLEAGDVLDGLVVGPDLLRTRVEVLTAQERVALDPECALGPDLLGPDLALVVTQMQTEVE
ncbi:MAG: hypothetical protein ACE37F_10375 [Nannocystaceae bacterium]|nr:hypothetical protein [bacterium]